MSVVFNAFNSELFAAETNYRINSVFYSILFCSILVDLGSADAFLSNVLWGENPSEPIYLQLWQTQCMD